MKSFAAVVLGFVLFSQAVAQDFQPTQLLSNPFIMCPAQVGNAGMPRASLLYHNDGAERYMAGFDMPFNKLHGGVGVNAVFENVGQGRSCLTAQGVYSYRWTVNEDFKIRGGAFFGVVNVNQKKYVLDNTTPSTVIEPSNYSYFDEGLSVAIDKNKLSFGLSCFHLLRPNISQVMTYRIDRTYSLFFGYDLWMMKGEHHSGFGASPMICATTELNNVNITAGFDFTWNDFFAGAYYRLQSRYYNTLIYHAGARIGRFQLGYAFDKTSSNSLNISVSGHEIFLNYFFEKAE